MKPSDGETAKMESLRRECSGLTVEWTLTTNGWTITGRHKKTGDPWIHVKGRTLMKTTKQFRDAYYQVESLLPKENA